MECQVADNEDHRLNYCPRWQDINFANDNVKINFLDIFSEDRQKLSAIIHCIQNVVATWQRLNEEANALTTIPFSDVNVDICSIRIVRAFSCTAHLQSWL